MNAAVIFAVHQIQPVTYSAEGRIALLCHLGIDVATLLTLNYKI